MTKGRIVLVPFPFDDLSGSKVRPAVCLTEPIGRHRHLVVAFVTSRLPADPEDTDLLLPADHPEFELTGLRVASAVRLHRLMTLPVDVIRRELGVLPPGMAADADGKLRRLFLL
jgi:mRNA interferase MazF